MLNSRKYYRHERTEMAPFLPDEYDTVLEIGCGEGEFINNLKSNCEIWGIEVDKKSAEVASKKLNTVLVGKYDRVSNQLPKQYFDLVICNDVIEHMEDYDAFLVSVKNKMKDNGRIVASIPNVRYYYNLKELLIDKDWRYREYGILDKSHLRYFTEKSIKRTFNEHGFIIEEFKGINAITSQKVRRFILILNIITAGSYRDLQYLQFGIRVRKAKFV